MTLMWMDHEELVVVVLYFVEDSICIALWVKKVDRFMTF